MKIKTIFLFAAILLLAGGSCTRNFQYTLEPISVPVNLTMTSDGGEYDLQFTSDNREADFAGYGVFQGNTESLALLNTDDDTATFTSDNTKCFVSVSSSDISYTNPVVKIRLNASSLPEGYHGFCSTTDLSIASGNYLAVRAYVKRDSDVWSDAATVLVP